MTGLYRNTSGLAIGSGLWQGQQGLWSGYTGLQDGPVPGDTPLFYMDNANSRFSANGINYASASALLASVNAVVSGVTSYFGDFEDPTSPYEYFPTPTFNSLPTLNLTASVSATVTDNELDITFPSGGLPAASWTLTGYKSRAFRWKAKGRWAASNPFGIAHTQQNSSFGGNNIGSATNYNSVMSERTTFGSGSTGNSWWGWRANGTPGHFYADDASLAECAPLNGFVTWADGGSSSMDGQAWSGIVDTPTLPALPVSGEKVFAQGDCTNTVHRIALAISTTGAVTLIVRIGGTTNTTLALGTYAPGDRLRIAYGISRGTNVRGTGVVASVNGGPSVTSYATTVSTPGVAYLRIGRDSAGTSLYDGTFNLVSFYQGRKTDSWCEYNSQITTTFWVGNGDSYMDGANGVALKTLLATASSRNCVNISLGGTTLPQQTTSYLNAAYLSQWPLVQWDGRDNEFVSIDDDLSYYQDMYSGANGRILIIPPIPLSVSEGTRYVARKTSLIAAFGAAKYFDVLPVLQALSDGSPADLAALAGGYTPPSCMQGDGQHLTSAAMTVVADAVQSSGQMPVL